MNIINLLIYFIYLYLVHKILRIKKNNFVQLNDIGMVLQ